MHQHARSLVLRIAILTGLILLLPLVAMQVSNEVTWSPGDFLIAGMLLGGAGLTGAVLVRRGRSPLQRAAIGGAVLAVLFVVWVQLAVGWA